MLLCLLRIPLIRPAGAACYCANEMVEVPLPPESDQARAIAAISDQLHLPVGQVGEVYWKEFERLSVQARIKTYLTVLTMRNVRSILGGALKHSAMR